MRGCVITSSLTHTPTFGSLSLSHSPVSTRGYAPRAMSHRYVDPFSEGAPPPLGHPSSSAQSQGSAASSRGAPSSASTYSAPTFRRDANDDERAPRPDSPPRLSVGSRGKGGAASAPNASSSSMIIAQNLYKSAAVTNDDHIPLRPASSRGGLGAAGRPQLLVCYLCGQQFGTNSLNIHRPQCYVKRLIQWERGALGLRGPKPLSPDEWAAQHCLQGQEDVPVGALRGGGATAQDALHAFNEAQFNGFTDRALVPCPTCARKFLPDRLQVHMRSCRPGHSARPVGSTKRLTPPPEHTGATATPPDTAPRPTLDELRMARRRGESLRASHGRGPEADATRPPPPPLAAPQEDGGQKWDGGEPHRDTVAADAFPDDPRRSSPQPFRPPPPAHAARVASTSPSLTAGSSRRPTASDSMAPARLVASRSAPGSHDDDLVPCTYCGRRFAPNRVEKHQDVCIERRTMKPAAASGGPSVTGAPLRPASPSASQRNATTNKVAEHPSANVPPPAGHRRATTPVKVGGPNRTSPPPAVQSSSSPLSVAQMASKFCHECGTPRVIATQKFCAECGSKFLP